MAQKKRGHLVIIGGAEDRTGECKILRSFVELSGGRKARLAVLSTASEDPRAGETYRRVFEELGAEQVRVLAIRHRDEANRRDLTSLLKDISGVFFTGGDQLRITSILGGSRLYRILKDALEDGVIMAGTSAGASAMSETMLVGGADETAPTRETALMAPGLGFLRDVVVDQHFAERGRIGRLLSVVAYNPFILGVGIDEDTAIVVSPDDSFYVVGSGTVTVLDGRSVTYSNVSESAARTPLTLTGVTLHILAEGYRYDLKERMALMNGRGTSVEDQ